MQQFQFLTRDGQIAQFKPHNPFAPGIIEKINTYPTEFQAMELGKILEPLNIRGTMSVLGINPEYDVVLYSLILEQV